MYHYQECGLRNVWLVNGYDMHTTPYGDGVSIHDIKGLHRAIGRGLVNKAPKLTGSELRFLRKEMGLSQSKLALILGNEDQTVALWEKRGTQPKIADRFVRALYREFDEGNAHIRDMIDLLVDADREEREERINFVQGSHGWKVAA
jgi:putative transcriptional regulator